LKPCGRYSSRIGLQGLKEYLKPSKLFAKLNNCWRNFEFSSVATMAFASTAQQYVIVLIARA